MALRVHLRVYNPSMSPDRKRNLSLISAGALSALTLGVFLASPNRGPVSAVIRFNEAVKLRDPGMLKAVSWGDINNEENQILQSLVAKLLENGKECRVSRVEREKDYALVYTVYGKSGSGLYERVFVAKYAKPVWLVDAGLTLSLGKNNGRP